MKLVFATTNPGKRLELEGLLRGALEVVSAAELAHLPEVEEDAETFEGNATKKALAFTRATGLPALADDSGLCVDALQGQPGVHSARYAPSTAERNARLLRELQAVPPERRTARFVCALALALPSGAVHLERGECEGHIALEAAGEKGFGYDPLFVLPDGRTLAQLSPAEKSTVSHRGAAFALMLPHLLALTP